MKGDRVESFFLSLASHAPAMDGKGVSDRPCGKKIEKKFHVWV